ncbi:MAG: mechanosensitive ion channel [Chloroflexi bacterium]|nr:mechanosensitive ion channel [Chloroflexota bacterium]
MPGLKKRVVLAAVAVVIGCLVFGVTAHLANTSDVSFLQTNRSRIYAIEITFFGIVIIELLANVTLVAFHRADALQTGIAVRATMRLVAYLILLVALVSILAENPALAIGVGGITGVVIAFSAQNLVGNAFAGVFLAINRPFRVGEEITIGGMTGTVTDIRMMHTRLDLGDDVALIPSNWIMTQVIRRKPRARLPWEPARGIDDSGPADSAD